MIPLLDITVNFCEIYSIFQDKDAIYSLETYQAVDYDIAIDWALSYYNILYMLL